MRKTLITLALLASCQICLAQCRPLNSGNGGTGKCNTATVQMGSANWDLSVYAGGIPTISGGGVGAITPATYVNVVGLWSGCSGTQYLGYDGNCHTPAGTGLTSVGLTAPPDLLTVGGSPLTSNGTLTQGKTNVAPGFVLRGPGLASYLQPYVVQSTPCVTAQGTNNWTCAFTGAVAAGDSLLVVAKNCGGYCTGGAGLSGTPVWALTDNAGAGDTFVDVRRFNNNDGYLLALVASAIGGATTVNLAQTGATGTDLVIFELLELANTAASPLDVQGTSTYAPAVTTTFATDIVLGFDVAAGHLESPSMSAGTGWTLVNQLGQTSPGPASVGAVSFGATSIGTYTPVINNDAGGSKIGFTVALKGLASPGASEWRFGPLDSSYLPELFPDMAGRSGITASGSSCAITEITDGIITGATCTP
jgi:hypothetical protein